MADDVLVGLAAVARRPLSDRQWARIAAFLATERFGRPPKSDRRFVEAVQWWRRAGVPWRDLPRRFGPWKTVFNRFNNWSKSGKWLRLFKALHLDRADARHRRDGRLRRVDPRAAGGPAGNRPKRSAQHAASSRRRST